MSGCGDPEDWQGFLKSQLYSWFLHEKTYLYHYNQLSRTFYGFIGNTF